MKKKLEEFKTLSGHGQDGRNMQIVKLKIRTDAVDSEISSLLEKIPTANDSVMRYINNRVAELDCEKKELLSQIAKADKKCEDNKGKISGYTEYWDKLSISDRITVVDALIERIVASKNSLEIKWKI